MALPPLASTRPDSPDRGVSPPTTTSARGSATSIGTLAPLRSPAPLDVPSPSGTHAAAPSRSAGGAIGGATPLRSTSGSPAPGPASPTPSQSPSRLGSAVSPRVVSGPRKLTKSQLAERLYGQLMEVLRTEWRRIKSSNLGVLSGTAVVEELLLRRIQAWASELHMLTIGHVTAAERLGELCRGMDPGELQQLLVMFDQTGHPELSDFVRVMVFNTSDPAAKTVVGDLRALRAAHNANRRARSTPNSRRRQSSALPPPPRLFQPHVPEDPTILRFASILPEGHRLVAGAHAVAARRRQEEEEEGRRVAEAREAKARARSEALAGPGLPPAVAPSERRPSDASVRQSVLAGRALPPEIQPYYLADVEDQWRRTVSTRVPCEGVFDSCIMLLEPLPMYEAPPDAALLRVEAEEAALAPPSRHGLSMLSVSNRPPLLGGARSSAASVTAASGAAGASAWHGPLGASTATAAFKRLVSSRPGSVGGPHAHGSDNGGLGPDGSGLGSSQPSSRFPGTSRRGPRMVSLVTEGGLDGTGESGADAGRSRRGSGAGNGGAGTGTGAGAGGGWHGAGGPRVGVLLAPS